MSVWDVQMKSDTAKKNEYPVAKPGEYEFQVEKALGKVFKPGPGSKIGQCAEIDLQLRVETPEGDVKVFERLYSDPICIWKMTAFAKCIGIFFENMTPGDVLKRAEGEIGRAKIKLIPATTQYPEKNEVETYIEKAKPAPAKKAEDDFEDLPF